VTTPRRSASSLDHPFAAPQCITVVSGLPRAGTSLVVQILAAAALPIAADDARPPDPDNPRGYLELAAVKGIRRDPSFLEACRGRVVKIVAPLLLELPRECAYRVVFVERDLAEVLASQRAMLRRGGRPDPSEADEAALERAYRAVLDRSRVWLEEAPDAPALFLSHRALLASTESEIDRLATFLARTGDPEERRRLAGAGAGSERADSSAGARAAALRTAMVAAVEPALYRSRAGS
jgi:hypothetical protein